MSIKTQDLDMLQNQFQRIQPSSISQNTFEINARFGCKLTASPEGGSRPMKLCHHPTLALMPHTIYMVQIGQVVLENVFKIC